jgi:HEPN domain-containing protein
MAVTYSASVPDLQGCLWPPALAPAAPSLLQQGEQHYGEFVLPIGTSFIRAVEDWRKGQPHGFRIDVRAVVTWIGQVQGQGGPPMREEQNCCINIARDSWLGLLAALGWDEFETFEIPVQAPKRHETLRQGLEHLHAAQAAYRLGHWPTVVTDARKAIEAAASATSDESDRKAKMEALVKSVVQGDANQAKRDTLSSLMLALRQLRDEAAHGGNLGCQIQREDAELALTVAVSIFRYLGESLAALEGRRGSR